MTLRDLDQVGELLAAAVEAGTNSISGVNFSVEDPQALVEQARQKALEDGAVRAKQMAEGLEITLGKPILLTMPSSSPVRSYPMARSTSNRSVIARACQRVHK